MKKNGTNQLLQWGLALVMGFAIVNALCFLYERQIGWLGTDNGAAPALWRPGTLLVHGTEGYGYARIDGNGFINPAGELADQYVLMMGSSHTQGKEVMSEQRYSTLVNQHFTDDSGKLVAYNIGCDGHFLPSQIKYFAAALTAFPNAGAITMEIGKITTSAIELHESLTQVTFDPCESAVGFYEMGLGAKAKMLVKEYLPFPKVLKKNLETLRARAAEETEGSYDYETELNAALALIRSEFDGPIAFVYHPTTKIQPDGTLKLGYSDSWEVFCRLCEKHRIDVIDAGPRFLQVYEDTHALPYGFANTTPGNGHLNAVGHKILAEEIISYLEELRV